MTLDVIVMVVPNSIEADTEEIILYEHEFMIDAVKISKET